MAELRFLDVEIPVAPLGPVNTLPALEGCVNLQQKRRGSLGEFEGLYIGYGFENTCFPYPVQDAYGREPQAAPVKMAVLENDALRASFLPEYGGRLWSLYDKRQGRELLYTPEAIRLGNLAVRNAWFAGGVEWNCGVIGHHPFTCQPVFAAAAKGEKGEPVLRMYQYERIRGVVYQMDFFLAEDAPLLYARMQIMNATDKVLPMYWWSNIAVPAREKGRVVVEADEAYTSTVDEVFQVPVPEYQGADITYDQSADHSVDYFWKIPQNAPKYVAYAGQDGRGLVQSSTARLRGRKLFVWGESEGGRQWQSFLAPEGSPGRYVEIQAGLAPTQYECLPMPPHTTWEWLEAYGPLAVDAGKLYGTWQEARQEVRGYLQEAAPAEKLEALLAQTRIASRAAGQLLMKADGWGALEELRRARKGLPALAAHLDFGEIQEEQRPWEMLLHEGRMGTHHPEEPPLSWMRQEEWNLLLLHAVKRADEDNWYTWLQLGISNLVMGRHAEAKKALKQSQGLQPNPWALYGLSCLLEIEGSGKKAARKRLKAARMVPENESMARATMALLTSEGLYAEAVEYYQGLPDLLKANTRLKVYWATAAAGQGNWWQAEALLSEEGFVLADLREGENILWEAWELVQQQRAEDGLKKQPLPSHLDFRMYIEQ